MLLFNYATYGIDFKLSLDSKPENCDYRCVSAVKIGINMGRHSTYTENIGNDICLSIAGGNSLVSYCKIAKIDYSTVTGWLNQFPEFAIKYAQAREIQADFMADEIMNLVDELPPLTPLGSIDPAWVSNQKNRIEARKWIASKLKPKKYGDKQSVELTGKDGEPLALRLMAIQERLLKDITPEAPIIENKPE